MPVVPLPTRAVALSWLPATSATLLALTSDPPNPDQLKQDPGFVLHALRYLRPTPDPDSFTLTDTLLSQPGLCETAAALIEQTPPLEAALPSIQLGLRLAEAAAEHAKQTGWASPDAAWCAGLLAPLGWYAAEACGETLRDAKAASALARRLVSRWRLPRWLQVAVGFPDIALESAEALGGHAGVLKCLREAKEAQTGMSVPLKEGDFVAQTFLSVHQGQSILPHLLRTCAKARQRSAAVLVGDLENTIDQLSEEVRQLSTGFALALRDAKLDALAEFAAGASHEINNPLAVITGNCQFLQNRETDPEKRKALDAIRRQTKRIHELLVVTRQFARPPQTVPTRLEVNELLHECIREFETVAGLLDGVQFEFRPSAYPVFVSADGVQLKQAVVQVLRNAVDAARPDGTVHLMLELHGDTLAIVIEDSGGGPSPSVIPHLFDPFFSGKNAGRGRGLGLSIAWRFAKLNGGDLTYSPQAGHPSRFVLSLPRLVSETPLAKSA